MPEITRFYGIVIKLFFGEFNGIFTINPLEMIEGDLPDRAKNLIIEWAEIYKKDLLDMWESQKFYKLPSLK